VPLHNWQRAIMLGLVPYVLVFVTVLDLLKRLGWPALHTTAGIVDSLAYLCPVVCPSPVLDPATRSAAPSNPERRLRHRAPGGGARGSSNTGDRAAVSDRHSGASASCAHLPDCSIRPVLRTLQGVVDQVLGRLTLSQLLCDEQEVLVRSVARATPLTAVGKPA